jgi:hypothetical protein
MSAEDAPFKPREFFDNNGDLFVDAAVRLRKDNGDKRTTKEIVEDVLGAMVQQDIVDITPTYDNYRKQKSYNKSDERDEDQ